MVNVISNVHDVPSISNRVQNRKAAGTAENCIQKTDTYRDFVKL